MSERHEQLVAYIATLIALVVVFLSAIVAGTISPGVIGKIEAFGLGTITGGLIGVLRIPQARTVTVDNTARDPIPVEPTEER
jgi:hypothetical protein